MKPERLNVLFVCSKNRWRSPTAERCYQNDPRVAVRSCGTATSAVRKIQSKDVQWADVVLVMEDKHRSRIQADFPDATRYVPIHVLDIPDDYLFLDPELVELIESATEPILQSTLDGEEA